LGERVSRLDRLFTDAGMSTPTPARVDGRSASSRAGADGRSASSRAGADGRSASSRAGDPAAYRQAAALAVQQATSAHDRVLERQAQAESLAEQVAAHERAAQVAKALALHLRADRFERWLLAEALDALVAGASRILRELSAGQYDLGHDNG